MGMLVHGQSILWRQLLKGDESHMALQDEKVAIGIQGHSARLYATSLEATAD